MLKKRKEDVGILEMTHVQEHSFVYSLFRTILIK